MKTNLRIAMEVLGPGFLGTLLLFVWNHDAFTHAGLLSIRGFGGYLLGAYIFAILPSLAYAYFMERWLKRDASGDRGFAGTIAVSTAMGTAAGLAIQLASEASVALLGAIVGLILGFVLAFTAPARSTAV